MDRKAIEAKIAALQQDLKKIDRFGADNYDEGTMLRFDLSFSKQPYVRAKYLGDGEWTVGRNVKAYMYAAIKAGGLWYTTGPNSPKGYTWEELTGWLSGKYVYDLWVVQDNREWLQII